MSPDFVQIGSFTVTKVVFDAFIIILSVITGGLITYLTTRAIENQKWKQQKKDRQQEQYREAIALALDWIAPIDTALVRIQSLSAAMIGHRITRDEFQKRWPDLLNELGRLDRAMPARLKVLLPKKFYDGFSIINDIDELYYYLLLTPQKTPKSGENLAELVKQASDQILAIKESSEAYKNMLIDEYKNSYD
ncbi:MAG: hypothetical protein ACOYZ8_01705 [Chloroflexota bacterium]